jgi:hypothetical protein
MQTLGRGVFVSVIIVACGSVDPVGENTAALTADECMQDVVGGKTAICHHTSGSPAYVHIAISQSACINAHAENHPEDFVSTTGDCSCVGNDQACQADAPCCSGTCIDGTCKDPCDNGCGGQCVAGETLGDACGTCGVDVKVCGSGGSIVCNGDSRLNECGGCTELNVPPGTRCTAGEFGGATYGGSVFVCTGPESTICAPL